MTDPTIPMLSGRLPVLGHLLSIHRDVVGLMRRGHREYGEAFRVDHGFGAHPIYLASDESFSLLNNKIVRSSANFDVSPLVARNTMIHEDGATHQRMRGAVRSPFSVEGLRAARAGEIVHDVIESKVRTWLHRGSVDVSAETREITLDIIFRLIGIAEGDLPAWRSKYHEFALGVIPVPWNVPGSPYWRSSRAIRWIDSRIASFIDDVRRRADRESILGLMAHGRDEEGRSLTDPELVAQVRFLGLAGHETAASVMTWTMLYLAKQPDLWTNLSNEALAASGPPVTPEDLASFPFAEALFRESLRIHPPSWFLYRRAYEDFDFGGYRIHEEDLLVIPLALLSRNEKRYPEPDRYVPERWLNRGRTPEPIEMCQFGGGPHFCLGYRLALLEVIQFIVLTARILAVAGRRPLLTGELPPSRHLPFTHARTSTVQLVRD